MGGLSFGLVTKQAVHASLQYVLSCALLRCLRAAGRDRCRCRGACRCETAIRLRDRCRARISCSTAGNIVAGAA